MAKQNEKKLIVGLDIGTSKVVAIVGEISNEGGIDIVGIGTSPSRGLRKGVVINIESTVASIRKAVEEAELMEWVERFYGEYYFRPKAAWRIVRKAIFDGKERKRLYKEAAEYLALRSKRKQYVADKRAANAMNQAQERA